MGYKDYKPVRGDQTGSVDTSSERLDDVQSVMTEDQLNPPTIVEPLVEVTDQVFSNIERDIMGKDAPIEADDRTVDQAKSDALEAEANPLDGSSKDVLAYAEANPDEVEDLLAAEEAGAARKGVLKGLAALNE